MSFEIHTIPFREIDTWASGDAWANAPVLPITPERAGSQQKNPHAKPDEPCLWVATNDTGRVVGFAGSLPGYDVRNSERMGWNTCWWVDPDLGKEAGMPLFFHFLKQWDQRVAFADMTSRTHAIIRQLGFCNTREEVLVHSTLKIPVFKLIGNLGFTGRLLSPLIRVLCHLVNGVQQVRFSRFPGREGFHAESIARINEEIFEFVRLHRQNDFIHRSLEEYRWIEENPWLVTRSQSAHNIAERYPFTYEVHAYRLEWVITRDEKSITSVMMVSARDGALKVLSYWGSDAGLALSALLAKVAGNKKLHSLVFSHPQWLAQLPLLKSLGLKTRVLQRLVGISKTIMEAFPGETVIQLGDGDSVFT
ncbi:MAG: hypothetical protein V2B15_17840 [Bacteroidota bacterium]